MKLIIKAIIFIGILIFAGCQDLTEEVIGETPPNAQTIIVTMIAKSSANPVFHSARVGAEAAAQDLSEKYSMIDVKINWRTPNIENAFEQAERIKNAVQDGTDAIIVSSSNDSILTSAINDAVDKGVEVMTFDSDAPLSKRFSFYGPNDIEIGERLMNELAKLIREDGEVAILGGNKDAPNLQNRVKGIRAAAEKFSGIKIVGEFYHVENAEEAAAEFLRVNAEYPNLKGWAMVGGWPFFNENLLDKIDPQKLKIVAVDALPVQLPYLEKGIVNLFLGQPTFQWGKFCVESIVDKIHHKKKVKEIIEMKLIPITIDNLGGWSRQLRAWGYKGIPDKYLVM